MHGNSNIKFIFPTYIKYLLSTFMTMRCNTVITDYKSIILFIPEKKIISSNLVEMGSYQRSTVVPRHLKVSQFLPLQERHIYLFFK